MAAITARSAKRVSYMYHDLYNLSTADLLFDEKKKKRRPAFKLTFFVMCQYVRHDRYQNFDLLFIHFRANSTEFAFNTSGANLGGECRGAPHLR